MSDTAVRVNFDDLVPGMVLAEAAVHMNGRVLLSAGACLTEKHLKIFKTWGVTEAYINGGSQEIVYQATAHLDAALVTQAEDEMKKKFIHMNIESDVVNELYRVSVREYAEFLAKNNG